MKSYTITTFFAPAMKPGTQLGSTSSCMVKSFFPCHKTWRRDSFHVVKDGADPLCSMKSDTEYSSKYFLFFSWLYFGDYFTYSHLT
jgi:hypothetical protein